MNTLKKYTIEVTPLDTLFFRGGMPFSMGEDSWTQTSILPNPSVIWGALFSTLFSLKKINLEDTNKLKIKFFFLKRSVVHESSEKILLPAPLDIFYEKNNENIYVDNYHDTDSITSNFPSLLKNITIPDVEDNNIEVKNLDNYFIDWVDFSENYPQQNAQIRKYDVDYFATNVSKIGIKKSQATGTSEESMLYQVNMVEFGKNWSLIVEFETKDFPTQGILRLGGEGKMASFKQIENSEQLSIKIIEKESIWFKIYFQTPAFFDSGNGITELSKLQNAQLYSASIGKPLHIGGFDIVKNEPKTMRKAIPSGSVYLFKGNPSKTAEEIKSLFNENDLNKGFCLFHVISTD